MDGKIWIIPKRFDQDAKDRVVRLVEDRVLAGMKRTGFCSYLFLRGLEHV